MSESDSSMARDEHRRFRSLFECMQQGVVYQDANGRITLANPAACRILGVTVDQLQGRTSTDPRLRALREDGTPFPGQDHPSMVSLRTGEPVHGVIMGIGTSPEAEIRWIRIDAVPQFLPGQDTPYEVFTTFIDVTAERQAALALRESQRAMANLLGNLPGMVYRCRNDAQWTMEMVSEGCLSLTGYPSAALLGNATLSFASLIHAEDQQRVWDEVQAAVRNHARFHLEYRIRTASGETVRVWESGRGVFSASGELVALEGFIADVSEQRDAEDANRVLAQVIAQSPNAIVALGLDLRIASWNDGATRIFGYTRAQAVGQPMSMLLTSKEALPPVPEMLMALRERGFLELETRTHRSDGTAMTSQFSLWTLHDADENPSGIVAYSQDITDRKRRQSVMAARLRLLELARNAQRAEVLRATLDEAEALTGSSIGFYHLLEADENTLSLQAWSTNTIARMCVGAVSGEHYAIAKAGVWVDCVRERKPVVHNDYASLPHRKGMPDGHVAVVRELVVPVIRGDKITAILGVGNKATDYDEADVEMVTSLADLAWDVAEQTRSDEALRSSERRLRDVIQTVADWVWEVDAQGRYTFASDSVQRLLGYTPEEVVGRTPFDFMAPDEAERVRREFKRIASGKATFADLENTMLHRDGTPRLLSTGGIPILDPQGNLLGYRGIDRDVTERRRIEAQLRQAQKMEAVGQLAGGVAHDFNNILAAMMMRADLMQYDPALPPKARKSVEELLRETERAAALTRQLLLFSRRQAMTMCTLDLNDTVDRLLKMLRRLLGEHIELAFREGKGPLWVKADASMIDQVLTNLCVNARDAMPSGGRLIVSTKRELLDGRQASSNPNAHPGEFIALRVEDSGTGMDETTLRRMFEPFFTTKDVGKGTGLGLATVFGIVEQHHGWIDVSSTLGQGSTFSVFLPLSEAPATDAPVAKAAPAISGGTETILLVEDDSVLREVTALTLRSKGYTVIEAPNGVEATKAWRANRDSIRMLLTDMVMPEGISGLELAERLREDDPSLCIIIASGYSAELQRANARIPEGAATLPKPFSANALAQLVRELLDKHP